MTTSDRPTEFSGANPVLKFENIGFLRDDEPVFSPVEFDLNPGQLMVIEGRNGSGKTTLLRVLAGFLDMSEGSVNYNKLSFPVNQFHEHFPLAYMGHRPGFKEDLSVAENLLFLTQLHEGRTTDLPEVIKKVGLYGYEDAHARTLSAGQRKRLALAALLLHPSKLWLMDEPFANLDAQGIELVHQVMHEHLVQNGMLITTSHGTFALQHDSMHLLQLEPAQ